jgi:hypothetical protein
VKTGSMGSRGRSGTLRPLLPKVTGAVGLDGSPPAIPYSVQARGRIAAGLSDVSRMGKSVEADPTNAVKATPRPAQGFLKIVK